MASFPSGFEEGIVCCFVCAWAHTSLWSCLLGFLGRYREALRNFWAPSGVSWGASGTSWRGFWELLELLEPPLGAMGASQGGSWVLPEHLGEAPGSSRDALGSVSGCFWHVLGSLLGLRESFVSGKDAKVTIIVLPKEFIGFCGPSGSESKPKSSRSGFEGPRGACGSGFERLWESAFEKSGSQAAEPSGTQRTSAELSRNLRRVKAKSLSWWL